MKSNFSLLAAASTLFGSLVNGIAIPSKDIVPTKRAACDNTATSRQCWGDYDLTTNW